MTLECGCVVTNGRLEEPCPEHTGAGEAAIQCAQRSNLGRCTRLPDHDGEHRYYREVPLAAGAGEAGALREVDEQGVNLKCHSIAVEQSLDTTCDCEPQNFGRCGYCIAYGAANAMLEAALAPGGRPRCAAEWFDDFVCDLPKGHDGPHGGPNAPCCTCSGTREVVPAVGDPDVLVPCPNCMPTPRCETCGGSRKVDEVVRTFNARGDAAVQRRTKPCPACAPADAGAPDA